MYVAVYLTVVEEPSTPYTEMIPLVELFPDTREMPLKTMPIPFRRPIIIYVEKCIRLCDYAKRILSTSKETKEKFSSDSYAR